MTREEKVKQAVDGEFGFRLQALEHENRCLRLDLEELKNLVLDLQTSIQVANANSEVAMTLANIRNYVV